MKRVRSIILLFVATFVVSAQAYEFTTIAPYAIAIDNTSGGILFEHNADKRIPPSSMSKLMTLYILFDKLHNNIVKMDQACTVSEAAWKIHGSTMFLRQGQKVSVRNLINGVITASGNDACITLAEGVAGSQENFVHEMNETAQRLGLKESNFANATGWPNKDHFMSVRDIAILAQRIYTDFPEYYSLFARKKITYNGITQHNRNELLWRNIGVDGIKTGQTVVGGFGIVVSTQQKGRRVFVVVNGLKSNVARQNEAQRLVNYAFNNFQNKYLVKKNQVITNIKVWFGKSRTIPIVAKQDVIVSCNTADQDEKVRITLTYDTPLKAPIKKDQRVGEIRIVSSIHSTARIIPLYTIQKVEKLSFLQKLVRKISILFNISQ